MTIPEFARKAHCPKKQCVLGDCYDSNMVFYNMINPYISNADNVSIYIDTSKASIGIVKYKLKALSDEYDVSQMKEVYNGMNIDQFNRTFTSTTKILKDNVLQITLVKKIIE